MLNLLPEVVSAVSFILVKIMDETSSGPICFSSPLTLTLIIGFGLVHHLVRQQLYAFCTVEP